MGRGMRSSGDRRRGDVGGVDHAELGRRAGGVVDEPDEPATVRGARSSRRRRRTRGRRARPAGGRGARGARRARSWWPMVPLPVVHSEARRPVDALGRRSGRSVEASDRAPRARCCRLRGAASIARAIGVSASSTTVSPASCACTGSGAAAPVAIHVVRASPSREAIPMKPSATKTMRSLVSARSLMWFGVSRMGRLRRVSAPAETTTWACAAADGAGDDVQLAGGAGRASGTVRAGRPWPARSTRAQRVERPRSARRRGGRRRTRASCR